MKLSDKKIVLSETINRALSKVWWQLSTSEGLKTFFSTENKVDLSIGGPFEIYFITENPYGQKGSEGCKVISFVKERQLTFTWNAPPQYPDIRNSDYHTWVVIDIEALSKEATKVTLTHAGWPEDNEWSPVFDYFTKAWPTVIEALKKSLN